MANKTHTRATEKSSASVRKPLPAARASRRLPEQIHPAAAFARAMTAPAWALSPADIFALQRTAGNRAVEQMLAERVQHEQQGRLIIQAKLTVGVADDPYEREADRIAAEVVRTGEPSVSHIQRKPANEEDEEETRVQRRGDGPLVNVEPGVERGIAQARSGGQSLPIDLRARMEQAFGANFSRVRVHTDSESDSLNRSLRSRAFTTGQDLFFKRGEYNPASKRGQELIAHELTHVVQQNGGAAHKRGLSVQRAPANRIQRSVEEALRVDRYLWKAMPTNLKVAMTIGAPIIETFRQLWESGTAAASTTYNFLAGDDPGIVRTLLSGLVAIGAGALGSAYGAAKGFLRGLAFGIGNPLYSVGKRVVRGVAAIPTAFNEARGIYDADPTGDYGNLPSGARRENYSTITKTDLFNYLLMAAGGTSSLTAALTKRGLFINEEGIRGLFSDANVPMLSETGKALSKMGGVTGIMGALTSLMDARTGYRQFRDTSRSTAQRGLGMGLALSGTASAVQQSATAAYHFGNLSQSGVAATAQVATGGAGVATGAIDIVRGLYGSHRATQNIARLENLQQSLSLDIDIQNNRQTPMARDIGQAASQASSTQEMRRTAARGTALKGVATVVGGALLAASAATPIGWVLLGVGGLIGGIFAIKRWWDKRKRKEAVAMKELGVTQANRDNWEAEVKKIKKETWWGSNDRKTRLKNLGPDPLEGKLEQLGFRGVSHFYANYIHRMANQLYDTGVEGRDRVAGQLIEDALAREAMGMPMRRPWQEEEFAGMNFKKIVQRMAEENIVIDFRGNYYPEVEELIESMGLKFDWRQQPYQPVPAKIAKSLDE